MKKPVDLGFLDFRTVGSRHDACHRKVELNWRFSPDVYLGVAEVGGADGEPCDYLVVMRRMPADRRLKRLVEAGEPVRDDLRRLAHQLAAFHATANRSDAVSHEGSRDAAGKLLAQGESVVLDASFAADRHRSAARRLADRTASDLVAVRCQAPEPVMWQRLATRAPGPSDADASVAAAMARDFDPWPDAVTVDTSGPPANAVTHGTEVIGSATCRTLQTA